MRTASLSEIIKFAAGTQAPAGSRPNATAVPLSPMQTPPSSAQTPTSAPSPPVRPPASPVFPAHAPVTTPPPTPSPAPVQTAPPSQSTPTPAQQVSPSLVPAQHAPAKPLQPVQTTPSPEQVPLPTVGLSPRSDIPDVQNRIKSEVLDFYLHGSRGNASPFYSELSTGQGPHQLITSGYEQYLIGNIETRKDGAYALDRYLNETDINKKREIFNALPKDLQDSLIWVDKLKRDKRLNDPKYIAENVVSDKTAMLRFRTLWEYGFTNAITKRRDGSRLDPKNKEDYNQIAENAANIFAKALDDGLLTVSDLNLLYNNFVADLELDPDSPSSAEAFQSWRENVKDNPGGVLQTIALFIGIPLVIGGAASILAGNYGFLPVVSLLLGGLGVFFGLSPPLFGGSSASEGQSVYFGHPALGAVPLYGTTSARTEPGKPTVFDTSDNPPFIPSGYYHENIRRVADEQAKGQQADSRATGKQFGSRADLAKLETNFKNEAEQYEIADFKTANDYIRFGSKSLTDAKKLEYYGNKRISDVTLNELCDFLAKRAMVSGGLSTTEKKALVAIAYNMLKFVDDDRKASIYPLILSLLRDTDADGKPLNDKTRSDILRRMSDTLRGEINAQSLGGFTLGTVGYYASGR